MPQHGLLLEEATGAIGGTAGGHPVGSLGRAAVTKLGGWPFDRSRGALMATDAADVAARLHATAGRVPLAPPGSALDEVAIAHWGELGADATDLDDRVAACRAAAGVYDSAFRPLDLPMSVVAAPAETAPTYSTYLLHMRDADALIEALAREGIEARRPIHARLLSAPGATAFYSHAVTLPCHPDLGLDELLYVADAVRRHLQGLPARP